jgi:hypothetical protein
LYRDFEGLPQESNGSLNVCFITKVEADPAAFWQDMMRFGLTRGDDLIPDFLWERDIDQPVAMDMAELPFSEAEFRASETVWVGAHALPGFDGFCDFCPGPRN